MNIDEHVEKFCELVQLRIGRLANDLLPPDLAHVFEGEADCIADIARSFFGSEPMEATSHKAK